MLILPVHITIVYVIFAKCGLKRAQRANNWPRFKVLSSSISSPAFLHVTIFYYNFPPGISCAVIYSAAIRNFVDLQFPRVVLRLHFAHLQGNSKIKVNRKRVAFKIVRKHFVGKLLGETVFHEYLKIIRHIWTTMELSYLLYINWLICKEAAI